MKCQKCSESMEKGFIAARYIYWTNRKQEIFWRAPPREDVIIRPASLFHMYDKSIEAHRCKECKLLMFDYSDVHVSETPESFLQKCVKYGEKIPIASEYCPRCGAKHTGGVES